MLWFQLVSGSVFLLDVSLFVPQRHCTIATAIDTQVLFRCENTQVRHFAPHCFGLDFHHDGQGPRYLPNRFDPWLPGAVNLFKGPEH